MISVRASPYRSLLGKGWLIDTCGVVRGCVLCYCCHTHPTQYLTLLKPNQSWFDNNKCQHHIYILVSLASVRACVEFEQQGHSSSSTPSSTGLPRLQP